ncbi:hypothetical protein RhiirA4_484642 [Rhizophagus irregularis]|uniref:Uncharacterized protein n=1 Tax=Rhizophagus irregularis TaxID=588596 RepID=A0A2I1HP83_9GLOM|nr:hypothetical protein RhiirA4_484642 [Rhizophagus irregularis]
MPVPQQFHDSSMSPSWHHREAKLDSQIHLERQPNRRKGYPNNCRQVGPPP